MNLNDLSNKLTNFKIKFTEKPSPTEISNMDLVFHAVSYAEESYFREYEFKDIVFNSEDDTVEIILE